MLPCQTFFALGLSNGGGVNSVSDKSIALGGAYRFQKNRDVSGLAVNWIEPVSFERKQLTTEFYYRFQPSPIIAITPSVQWVYQPVLDSSVTAVFYFGFRARLTI
jgi:porin